MFTDAALDAYLETPDACREEIETAEEVERYFDALVRLGVPSESAERVLCENLPVELTSQVFGQLESD